MPRGSSTSTVMCMAIRLARTDLAPPRTYDELRARGVDFPQPPVQQSWGWWSMFQDQEGNRFALHPREGT